ncbi:hypothetical protein [Endozoicomonas sp. ONNA1]|uniref:hypothetical protein n=1 Tax=Endozoicomonas sp. ONNA1 TaxID=2828740 RepID=UPI00214825DA|nr:hypothetical protein [Endozoicomonas sp. ONNA1]
MKIKPGSGKYFFWSLLLGTLSGAALLLIEAPQIMIASIPAGVTAGAVFAFRSEWQYKSE